jgi:uncharacterized OB-fold protein
MSFFPDVPVTDYRKPKPLLTATNRPYWEAAREHRFHLQRCRSCAAWIYPISVACQACGTVDDYEWTAPSGRAKLSSWVVYHHAFDPFEAADVPYPVAEVELEEGMRLVTQLVGVELDGYRVGLELVVDFRDVAADFTAIVFAPRDAAGRSDGEDA